MTPKLTPDEAWKALEQLVAEENADELDRLEALSGPELDRELAREGLDPDAERAHAQAVIRKIRASREGVAPGKVVRLRPWATRFSAKVAAAAAMLGPAFYLALSELVPSEVLVGSAPDGGASRIEAEALRAEAANALEAHHWARCIALLDEAKRKDPEGDAAPGVQDARRIAMAKLGLRDKATPNP